MTTNKETEMSTKPESHGERVARLFHEIYERLAPSLGYETRKETRQFDPTSPNGKLMIAVCSEVAALLAADDKAGGESLESMLSTATGIVLGYKDRIGYLPGSVIDKEVQKWAERLKNWNFDDTYTRPQQAAQVAQPFKVVVNESIPEGEVHCRDSTGKIITRIVDIEKYQTL